MTNVNCNNTNKAFYPHCIPIVFSSNDYFVPYMSTMIQSIMATAKKEMRYCFYILYRDISDKNKELLKCQTELNENFSVVFVNVAEYFNNNQLYVSNHITIESYFRLLIPYLFSEYQKVIYLDGDMICRTDISELYDVNLDNFLLAAVWDTDVSRYYYPKDKKYMKSHNNVMINLKNPNEYFNGGLIIFNIPLFRDFISLDDLLTLAASRKWQVHDQDVLNFLCHGKTLLLPYHWNFIYSSKCNYLPEIFRAEYLEAQENPKIVHYKPWDNDNYIPFFLNFWIHAVKTPFIDVILDRMKKEGFISVDSLQQRMISNITHRKGIGLKFILTECCKAWLFRDRKN